MKRALLVRAAIVAGTSLVLVLLALALTWPLAARAVLGLVAGAAGYRIETSSLSVSTHHATLEGVDVRTALGEPVATVRRVDIEYNLRDLLPGGRRLFGLVALRAVAPHVTIVHHRNGSWNIPIPAQSNARPAAGPALDADLQVQDGAVTVDDETKRFADAQHFALDNVNADAHLHPNVPSRFTARAVALAGGIRSTIAAKGVLDDARGYERSHVTVDRVALAPLVNYIVDSATLRALGGTVRGVDVVASGLLDRSGAMERHIFVRADLERGQLLLGGVDKPIADAHGTFYATESTLATPLLHASLNGVPLAVAGGLYGLPNAKLQLGVRGGGPVSALLAISSAAARIPLRGNVALQLHVSGDATKPLVIARVTGRDIRYAALPIDGVAATVALLGTDATIVHATASYDGARADARGNVTLGTTPTATVVARLDAPPGRIPYADRIVPHLPLRGTAVIDGVGSALAARGIVSGDAPTAKLSGTFDVDGNGRGRIGPFTLDFPNGHYLYARAQVDARKRTADVIAQAHDVVLRDGRVVDYPGVVLPALPQVSGALDVAFAGELTQRGPVFAAGDADVRGLRVAGFRVDAAHARVVGSHNAFAASDVAARGPWGSFAGGAAGSGSTVALSGRFRGDLAALGAALGQGGLRGSIDAPLRALRTDRGVVAQIDDARLANANVRGVDVSSLSATVGLRGSAVDVYAANAGVAGGRVVASGSFGDGGSLAVSAADLRVPSLGGPLRGGRVTALATVTGNIAHPNVTGAAALNDATVEGLPVAASSSLGFDGRTLTLRDADGTAAGAVVSAGGSIAGLAAQAPQLALDASVRGGDLHTLAALAPKPLPVPIEGDVSGDFTLRGAATRPAVAGSLTIGAGSVNGLGFHDLHADVAASGTSARVPSAHVTVGTTRIALSGSAGTAAQSLHVRAPGADLADFNDFFDDGDVLAGHGSIDVAVTNTPNRVTTSGNVALQDARFRRFTTGATQAHWSTAGSAVRGTARVDGKAGVATVGGSIALPAREPLRDMLDRARIDATAQATGVDLGTWLPAANVFVPVIGHVDAQASVHGVGRAATATATADMRDALIGRIPVQTATLAAAAQRGRVTVTRATLAMQSLTVTASGSFGLRPTDPVDLRADAQSPDIGVLAHVASGKTFDAAGALTASTRLTGNARAPQFAATVDVANARYATLVAPRVHAALAASGTTVALNDAEVDLKHGMVRADARIPFDLQRGLLRGDAPLSATLQADKLDVSDFAPLLPKGTSLAGLVDGTLQVAGTAHAPTASGALALSGGTFSSPQLRSPLRNVAAHLALQDRTATLTGVHADIGKGSVDASGAATLGDLRNPAKDLAFHVNARASAVQLDAPNYVSGTFNGTLDATRVAGAPLQLAGDVTIPTARVPLSAFVGSPSKGATPAPLPPVAFNLDVHAGRDVRVQSGQVDIGGEGSIHVGGTLAAPQLAGTLLATGGSVNFYRNFQLQRGRVRFDPSDGVMPTISAVATTRVPDPSTDVTLTISGLAPDHLNVELASDPVYDRSQILGLLVGAQQFGAISGVATTSGTAPTASQIAQSYAQGALSQQFTRQLLEPLSAHLGQSLGLNQLAINYDPGGGFAASARKGIARNVDAVYAETFNYPTRQSFGLESHPSAGTSLQLTFFQQQGTGQFSPQIYTSSSNQALTVSEPAAGTSGFSFVVQHKFWAGARKPKAAPKAAPQPPDSPVGATPEASGQSAGGGE